MKKHLIAMSMVTTLSACSAPEEVALQPSAEKTSHPSQGVYEIYYTNAIGFNTSANQLASAAKTQCFAGSTELSAAWIDAMQAWMPIQGGDLGSPEADNLAWKVQFWPDKKDTTGRQVKTVLRTSPEISVLELKSKGAPLQGLTALEWLIFEPGFNDERCPLAVTITKNLVDSSDLLVNHLASNPWKELTNEQWNKAYLSLLSDKLSRMAKKISLPLANLGNPRPYFAESWRSQASYQNLYTNLISLDEFIHAPGGLIDLLEPLDPRLSTLISSTLQDTIATWPKDQSLFTEIQTKQGYTQALSQLNKIEQLKYLISEQAAQTLGIVVGFNSTDGD